jgi:hypothetical protein
MTIILVDNGAAVILKAFFNNSWTDFGAGKGLVLRLYENNITPADTDTKATYTQATAPGYVEIGLSNGSWTQQQTSNIEEVVYAKQTFTFTGAGNTIYGYYVVTDHGTEGSKKLVWAESFAPFTPTNNGDKIEITPKFQLSKGTPS